MSGGATEGPYNKDTFLLISAGPDMRYGSADDVANFERAWDEYE